MNINENLQFAIVGKFPYGWPELTKLREQIPVQYGVKADCKVGFLHNKHVLIRLELMKDFIKIMSKSAYYIAIKDRQLYEMHPQI